MQLFSGRLDALALAEQAQVAYPTLLADQPDDQTQLVITCTMKG